VADKTTLVTIYAQHNVGFVKHEGKLQECGEKQYAQNKRLPYVTFIPKGKRKPQTIVDNFLVLDGLGYPDPPDAYNTEESKDGLGTRQRGKYSMFDPRYAIEVNAIINAYSNRFIADYRWNKTTALSEEERRQIERRGASKQVGLPAVEVATPTPNEKLDPELLSDDRKRATAELVQRLGQADFRRRLIDAFRGRCAITRCDVEEVLQAAHIVPCLGPQSNAMDNGLLLRADIHNIFDLHHLSIDPATLTVCLSSELRESSYAEPQGVLLACPEDESARPSPAGLRRHYETFRSIRT